MLENKIFISHRSLDKEIADILFEFLIGVGVPREYIFCSSLPGNDVNEKISAEVKKAIHASTINIVLLSNAYYQSAYCLNEAGIIWFLDNTPTILIALPEINESKMYGFLNSEYKIRRSDNSDDIAYIFDAVQESTGSQKVKASVLSVEIPKLIKKYKEILSKRTICEEIATTTTCSSADGWTDDEKILLYYIYTKKTRRVLRESFISWLTHEEIYNIDTANAFDLIAANYGKLNANDDLELEITSFRKLLNLSQPQFADLEACFNQHKILSKNTFCALWSNNKFDDIDCLFLSYIIEERISSFGDRWKSESQIYHISEWENKNDLKSTLSINYGTCLNKFILHNLVNATDWTSYGNPREYTLCSSLKKYLLSELTESDDLSLIQTLSKNKLSYQNDPPPF